MPVEAPGDGGIGYSWFAIEVTSEYVDPGPEPPPPPPPPPTPTPAPVFDRDLEPVVHRHEDRFPAFYRVVTIKEDRYRGSFNLVHKTRFPVMFNLVRGNEDRFIGFANLSNRIARLRREDEELMTFLMDDE